MIFVSEVIKKNLFRFPELSKDSTVSFANAWSLKALDSAYQGARIDVVAIAGGLF